MIQIYIMLTFKMTPVDGVGPGFGCEEVFVFRVSEGGVLDFLGVRSPSLYRTGLAQQPPLVIVSGVSWQRDVEKLTARKED